MSKVYIPQDYHTPLSVYEMQRAIEFIKSNFQVNLSNALNLRRVSAPLFVDENSGLNDNLNGVERPVSFDIPDVGNNACHAHVQCDSIIMDKASISSIPEINANHIDAQIIHEAAIGRINDEQLIKLRTFGMTEEEAEAVIIENFLN